VTVSDANGGEATAPTGSVQLAVDGVQAASCQLGAPSGSASTCEVDVTAAAGAHQVTAAYAGDVDHAASSSGPVQLIVEAPPVEEPPTEEPPTEEPPAEEPPADTTAPAIEIVSPSDGAVVLRGTQLVLAASADDDTGVTRVVFEVNGAVRCTLTQPQWTCEWTAPKGKTGTFTVVARAFDAAGNASSTQISVTTTKG
jgi:Bacterial Ig domain/Bacterial Ig-like domain (group 3)